MGIYKDYYLSESSPRSGQGIVFIGQLLKHREVKCFRQGHTAGGSGARARTKAVVYSAPCCFISLVSGTDLDTLEYWYYEFLSVLFYRETKFSCGDGVVG